MADSLRTDPPAIRAARRQTGRLAIHVAPARAGFVHPAGPGDIRRLLELAGPPAVYGVRSIELRQAVGVPSAGQIVLARLDVPGRIVLYEQPRPPWFASGLPVRSVERLRRAGAVVDAGPAAARIEWPGATLRDLLLFDGLMHEIGHHLVQHHRGKRTARVLRTADHERRADAFADAWRAAAARRAGR